MSSFRKESSRCKHSWTETPRTRLPTLSAVGVPLAVSRSVLSRGRSCCICSRILCWMLDRCSVTVARSISFGLGDETSRVQVRAGLQEPGGRWHEFQKCRFSGTWTPLLKRPSDDKGVLPLAREGCARRARPPRLPARRGSNRCHGEASQMFLNAPWQRSLPGREGG